MSNLYEMEGSANRVGLLGYVVAMIAAVVMSAILVGSVSAEVSDKEGIACVVGESSSEGFWGMEAVSDALQNRGYTKGVYGCTAPHIDQESAATWKVAEKAWESAKTTDPTWGATHWENVLEFGKPEWSKRMVRTVVIGNHSFYKPRGEK